MRAAFLVVGGGVSGLACAYELRRAGRDVHVVEAVGVGAGQSQGLARIFRVAHEDAALCALAARDALPGWRRWERELGVSLVGREGVLVRGEELVEARARAMDAAGAPYRIVDDARVSLSAGRAGGPALLDEHGGAIRARRTLAALAGRLDGRVHRARVEGLDAAGDGVRVSTSTGEIRAGHVVLCAGHGTPVLAAQAGIDVGYELMRHVRLTYGLRGEHADRVQAALICPDAYGVPLGSSGRYAIGMHDVDGGWPAEHYTADEVAVAERARQAAWVPEHLPGLEPAPVDEVRCEFAGEAAWKTGPDDFCARQAGPVTALVGNNLMKFAPTIGGALASSAASGSVDERLSVQTRTARRRDLDRFQIL